MITIIPAREILKAVTDLNVSSQDADKRRIAFDYANDLISLANVDILLEGLLFEQVKHRLNDDHINFFKSAYRVDNSVKGLTGFNFSKAISWIAKSEEKSKKVIILSDNVSLYSDVIGEKIKVVKPSDFIVKYNLILHLYEKREFRIDDAINIVFFPPFNH